MNAFSLTNETALITGGGTGLGLAVAQCMVTAGARVLIVGRRVEPLQAAVEQLGPNASYDTFDVTDFDAAPALVERAVARLGSLSILVNNAGIHLKRHAAATSLDEFQRVLDTHLLGAFALTQAAIPAMRAQQHGSVVFMASMASIMGLPEVVAYAAAKTAYLGVMRTLATELAANGIRVNAVAPGWIESDMLNDVMDADPDRRDRVLSRTPLGRFGQPDDIGWAAVYLCAPAAKFITGTLLTVDGGVSIGF